MAMPRRGWLAQIQVGVILQFRSGLPIASMQHVGYMVNSVWESLFTTRRETISIIMIIPFLMTINAVSVNSLATFVREGIR